MPGWRNVHWSGEDESRVMHCSCVDLLTAGVQCMWWQLGVPWPFEGVAEEVLVQEVAHPAEGERTGV